VFTFLSGWATVLAAILVNPHFASRWVASSWARILAWVTPVRVTVEGAQHADRSHSYVVVSNHASQYDILALYGFLRLDLKWVMKMELRKVPGVGIGCEKAGHIFVDRTRPEQAKQAICEALERLGDGIGILFFPEGTRSLDGRMLPFKKGAFRTAADTGLPLLPVTIIGSHAVLPAKTLRLFPGHIRLVLHPPIDTVGVEPLELLRQSREVIASALPQSQRPG
jgi:1-acyl-sn-glycerol-3-phosphate acyltransferase